MASDNGTGNSYPMKVGDLPGASVGADLVWAHRNRTVGHAETLMLLNRYSQIPVFDHGEKPLRNKLAGLATWQSIACARLTSPDPKLADALSEKPPVVSRETDLFLAVPAILYAETVLVEECGVICGIVTAHDLAELLADRSEPFFVLSETEAVLRDLVTHHGLDVKQRESEGSAAEADNLSMSDCIGALLQEDAWQQLGTSHDRSVVRKALDRSRKARNHLMHARKQETEDIRKLRNMLDYLRALASTATSPSSDA